MKCPRCLKCKKQLGKSHSHDVDLNDESLQCLFYINILSHHQGNYERKGNHHITT